MSLQLTDRIKGKPELSRLCETDDGFVALYWRETPGAQQFIIEKLNRETGLFDKIARVPENVFSYIDTDVEAAQVYAYRITAKRVKNDGSLMIRRGAAQNVSLSDPHQVFMKSADHPAFGVAVLGWERDDRADGYRISRRPSGVSVPLPLAYLEGQTLTFRDDTLVSGQIYYYSVQSFRKAEDDELVFSHAGTGNTPATGPEARRPQRHVLRARHRRDRPLRAVPRRNRRRRIPGGVPQQERPRPQADRQGARRRKDRVVPHPLRAGV